MSLNISLIDKKTTDFSGRVVRIGNEVNTHLNVTHNLTQMADEAGLYKPVWRPGEAGINKASQLAPILINGLGVLVGNPDHFKQYNPKNGYGSYDSFLVFLGELLLACLAYPEARLHTSR